jgi:hypothetical protein
MPDAGYCRYDLQQHLNLQKPSYKAINVDTMISI